VNEAANVQNPVLIIHGLDDEVVSPESSEEWVEALRQAGKTYEYITYANESHGLLGLENRLDS
jgi:dipeptidyl aminopeptidase/acylaminoacyl peptidase